MFAIRLVQLIETHADKLADGVMRKIQSSTRCSDLVCKVPAEELRRRAHEIYRNLGDWILNKTESEIEERYIGLGTRRARQGVAFSHFFWAVTTTKEYLWEYLESEGLIERPVELFGQLDLLHHLDRFFDRALYFAALGYEKALRDQPEYEPAYHSGGRG